MSVFIGQTLVYCSIYDDFVASQWLAKVTTFYTSYISIKRNLSCPCCPKNLVIFKYFDMMLGASTIKWTTLDPCSGL